MNRNRAYLHDLSVLPGRGGPQAIFRPRQKRQARVGFLSPSAATFLFCGSGLSRMPKLEARGAGDLRGDQPRDTERYWAIGEWMWIGL
jgi:hypothetical protein